jgi:hypothetical protein
MKKTLTILPFILLACAAPKDIYKGVHDGVEISYRWNHPKDKASELLLKLSNTTPGDKRVDLAIDLYVEGRTVETLLADTCIGTGRTLNGKLNGIWFVPERITTERIKNGSVKVEMTRTVIEEGPCR